MPQPDTPKGQPPTVAEINKTRAWMLAHGVRPADFDSMTGGPNRATREAFSAALNEVIKKPV